MTMSSFPDTDVEETLTNHAFPEFKSKRPTADDVEAIYKQAYKEGLEKGLAAGKKQGIDEIKASVDSINKVADFISEPLAELDDKVVDELSQLAIIIAKQLLRRELSADPGQVIAVVRAALDALPLNSQNIRIHLNPQDISLIEEIYHKDEMAGFKYIENPSITRGGCKLETDVSVIDATIESQVAAISAEMLGGTRVSDEPE